MVIEKEKYNGFELLVGNVGLVFGSCRYSLDGVLEGGLSCKVELKDCFLFFVGKWGYGRGWVYLERKR